MSLENTIRAIAGTFILASLLLAHFVSPYWYWFTAFVGVNLLQSAFTKWCLMEQILKSTVYRTKTSPAKWRQKLAPGAVQKMENVILREAKNPRECAQMRRFLGRKRLRMTALRHFLDGPKHPPFRISKNLFLIFLISKKNPQKTRLPRITLFSTISNS